MRYFVAVVVLSAIGISAGHAQMKGMESHGKVQGQSHKGTAVVKKVDRAGGKVTLAHDPIRSINWPAMTMTFMVKDKVQLDKLSPDRKIEFEFVQQGSDYVITSVK